MDGVRYGLDELFDGDLPGHIVTGSNITVSSPVNGTKYVCVIPLTPPNPTVFSDPAFLYIAGKLHDFFLSSMYILICICTYIMYIYVCI